MGGYRSAGRNALRPPRPSSLKAVAPRPKRKRRRKRKRKAKVAAPFRLPVILRVPPPPPPPPKVPRGWVEGEDGLPRRKTLDEQRQSSAEWWAERKIETLEGQLAARKLNVARKTRGSGDYAAALAINRDAARLADELIEDELPWATDEEIDLSALWDTSEAAHVRRPRLDPTTREDRRNRMDNRPWAAWTNPNRVAREATPNTTTGRGR